MQAPGHHLQSIIQNHKQGGFRVLQTVGELGCWQNFTGGIKRNRTSGNVTEHGNWDVRTEQEVGLTVLEQVKHGPGADLIKNQLKPQHTGVKKVAASGGDINVNPLSKSNNLHPKSV